MKNRQLTYQELLDYINENGEVFAKNNWGYGVGNDEVYANAILAYRIDKNGRLVCRSYSHPAIFVPQGQVFDLYLDKKVNDVMPIGALAWQGVEEYRKNHNGELPPQKNEKNDTQEVQ